MIVPRGRLARCSSRGDALFCLAGRKFAPAKIVEMSPGGGGEESILCISTRESILCISIQREISHKQTQQPCANYY
jgi:hypothetical protein